MDNHIDWCRFPHTLSPSNSEPRLNLFCNPYNKGILVYSPTHSGYTSGRYHSWKNVFSPFFWRCAFRSAFCRPTAACLRRCMPLHQVSVSVGALRTMICWGIPVKILLVGIPRLAGVRAPNIIQTPASMKIKIYVFKLYLLFWRAEFGVWAQ